MILSRIGYTASLQNVTRSYMRHVSRRITIASFLTAEDTTRYCSKASFAKKAYERDYISQKRPMIFSILYSLVWCLQQWDMTHSCVRYDSWRFAAVCSTQDMSSYMRHDSCVHQTQLVTHRKGMYNISITCVYIHQGLIEIHDGLFCKYVRLFYRYMYRVLLHIWASLLHIYRSQLQQKLHKQGGSG